jgi:hypothetical protein
MKEETLEEAMENRIKGINVDTGFRIERSYSEEEVINLLYIRSMCQEHYESDAEIREWFNKFKKK